VLKFEVQNGRVVERTTGKLTADEGHLHLDIDGKLERMAYGITELQLPVLAAGPHSVQLEFVAVDHAPFRNRPKAVVLFTVPA
jgi:hypothetical protein